MTTEQPKVIVKWIGGDRTHWYFSETLGKETRYGKRHRETGEVTKIEPWNKADMAFIQRYG